MTDSWIEEILLCFRHLKPSRDYLSTLMYLSKNVIICGAITNNNLYMQESYAQLYFSYIEYHMQLQDQVLSLLEIFISWMDILPLDLCANVRQNS